MHTHVWQEAVLMVLLIYLVDINRLNYFFLFFITWELLFLIEV